MASPCSRHRDNHHHKFYETALRRTWTASWNAMRPHSSHASNHPVSVLMQMTSGHAFGNLIIFNAGACNCLRTRRTSVFAVGNLSCTLQFADSTFASLIRISHSHLAFAFGIRNFMCDSEIRNLSQGVAVALQYLYLLHAMQPSQTTRSTQFIPRFTKTACTYVYFEHPAQTITATSFLSLR